MSNYYRILNKSGGYSWLQSCATLICNTKNADEQSIICVNYVLRYYLFHFPRQKRDSHSNSIFVSFQRPSVRRHRDGSMSDRRQTRNWYQGRSRRKMRSAWQKTKWVFRGIFAMLKLSPIIQLIFCRRWNRTEVTLVQQWGSHCQACGRNWTDVSSFRRWNETKSYQLSCN